MRCYFRLSHLRLPYGRLLLLPIMTILLSACGGGSGGSNSELSNPSPESDTPTGPNVQPISVNGGLNGVINLPFTNVIVCEPGGSQCVTVNHVLVDTGSIGLRLSAAAVAMLALPPQLSAAGAPLGNCTPFVDGSYAWGQVKVADVKIAQEIAASIPIQVFGDSMFPSAPADCVNGGIDFSAPPLIANGILGVGNFREDCGPVCSDGTADFPEYYECPISGCVATNTVALNSQVQNPVAHFIGDNNGVVIQMPSIPAVGTTAVNGWMIFGIGTRSNNALGAAKVLQFNQYSFLSTTYNGTTYPASFTDTGSNGLFFPDTNIQMCTTQPNAPVGQIQFFCPSSTLHLAAIIHGGSITFDANDNVIFNSNVSSSVTFNIVNADTLPNNFLAFDNLGGLDDTFFDWGMPFFYGRKVFNSIGGDTDTPYIAF